MEKTKTIPTKAQVKPTDINNNSPEAEFKILLLKEKPKSTTAWVEYKKGKKKWRGSLTEAKKLITEMGWEFLV